jgi:hypothetical protein
VCREEAEEREEAGEWAERGRGSQFGRKDRHPGTLGIIPLGKAKRRTIMIRKQLNIITEHRRKVN